jgi:phytoene dehydrogenase-like protein
MATERADAVVIGAGQNGLVGANILADAGLDVIVLEANDEPGGAVRSGEVTRPGFVHDRFSAFYPLGVASPHIRALDLESRGLEWVRSKVAVAHPSTDGRCVLLSTDLDETAASLDEFARGDGDAWRRLYGLWERHGGDFLDFLFAPPPGLGAIAKLAAGVKPRGAARLARFAMLPVRRLAEEAFEGEGGAWLLAGNALHADLTPDSAGGGLFGWILAGLGQQLGFPVARGGASAIIDAMVSRLEEKGGRVVYGARAEAIEVSGGRATAVRTADGTTYEAAHAVLASVAAPNLYEKLLPSEAVPVGLRGDLRRFQLDNSTVKVDWALSGPIPWKAERTREAGTVHVSEGMDGLTKATSELVRGLVPEQPFLVVGQYSMFEETRAPEGQEAAWGYTHIPQKITGDAAGELGSEWGSSELERFADRMEAEMERFAPGFRDLVLDRYLAGPAELEAGNANLINGAINAGTAQIHQQAVFRPFAGSIGPYTPVKRLYLASASAHPGGALHGGCGANAAWAALAAKSPVAARVARVAARRAARNAPAPRVTTGEVRSPAAA